MNRARAGLLVVVTAALLSALAVPSLGGDASARSSVPYAQVSADVRVVALGDSVPAGSHCACSPYPHTYGQALGAALGRSVAVRDDARGGWDSADLLHALRPGTQLAADSSAADVVLVQIGANDLSDHHDEVSSGGCRSTCVTADVRRLHERLARIGAALTALRQGRPTVVVWLGYWNVFEDGSSADGVAASRAVTARVNRVIREEATATDQPYIGLVQAFRGHGRKTLDALLAKDGDHPSASGHALIESLTLAATQSVVQTRIPLPATGGSAGGPIGERASAGSRGSPASRS